MPLGEHVARRSFGVKNRTEHPRRDRRNVDFGKTNKFNMPKKYRKKVRSGQAGWVLDDAYHDVIALSEEARSSSAQ